MCKERSEFTALTKRVQDGCDLAAAELLDEYGPQVCRAVRRRLNQLMRSKFDTHDFAQAVWMSFFADRDLIANFESPDELVAFLSRVARNKVVDEFRRRFATKKLNINRERVIDDDANGAISRGLTDPGPSPSEIAIANDEWAAIVRGQPSKYRRILELRVAGSTYEEIAGTVSVNEKTVRRVIKRIARQSTHERGT